MITRRIRDFVNRDWRAAREAKDAYWAERIERLGPAEGFRIADDLRRQAALLDPDWPRLTERSEDLHSHVRVAGLMRRASAPRRG